MLSEKPPVEVARVICPWGGRLDVAVSMAVCTSQTCRG